MPVKSGRCVKTGAVVAVLEYGYAQTADIFQVGDSLVLNFSGDIFKGVRLKMDDACKEYEPREYSVSIGLAGFYHSDKNVLVVPIGQFEGRIFDPATGQPKDLTFKKASV